MIDQGFGFDSTVQQTREDTFVEVCYAKSVEDASSLCRLLAEHAIAALVETAPAIPGRCGVAVLVRADRLVEASELLTLEMQDQDTGDAVDPAGDSDVLDLDSPDLASEQDDDDDDDDSTVDLFEDPPDF